MLSHNLIHRINMPPPGHYIIAVSGGVDSMVLLHLLAASQPDNDLRLRVAHFNHGIRSDSHLDQKLVRRVSRIYGLPFHTVNAELGPVSEEKARAARYKFLSDLAARYAADAIITAHHFDDRQETSLFNVSRGAGPVGAAALRSEQRLLRPLLGVRKSELRQYAQDAGLPWREDSTNTSIGHSRNFIRHELLPLARRTTSGFDIAYGNALTRLDALNTAVDRSLAALIIKHAGTASLSRSEAATLQPQALQQAVLYMARQLEAGAEINRRTLQQAAQLVRRGQTGSEASLTGSLVLRLSLDSVTVSTVRPAQLKLVPHELVPNGSVRFGRHQLSFGSAHATSADHYHVAGQDLKVRAMKAGDRIDSLGLNGTKKLQDIFVDAKIGRSDRAHWPVVTRTTDDQVVWVPRLAISRHLLVEPDHPQAYCLIHEVLDA